jgi:small subunit ribosomal protein S20
MPIIRSAIKDAKKSEERRERRLPSKTSMKTMIRKLADLAKEGRKEEARALLPKVFKAIDTAAKKRIIHSRNAARKKSSAARLAA